MGKYYFEYVIVIEEVCTEPATAIVSGIPMDQ
jgi:hypothetical protein